MAFSLLMATGLFLLRPASELLYFLAKLDAIAWIAVMVAVVMARQWCFGVCVLAAAPPIGMLIGKLAMRIAFLVRHGAADCAGCDASPLAVYLGLTAERALLLGLLLLVWGLWRLSRKRGVVSVDWECYLILGI